MIEVSPLRPNVESLSCTVIFIVSLLFFKLFYYSGNNISEGLSDRIVSLALKFKERCVKF
jgi:hypothetical protein